MVIPPLQSSFSFLSPGGTSEEDEFPFEDSNNSTPREDEDDKATGFGELKPLNQFYTGPIWSLFFEAIAQWCRSARARVAPGKVSAVGVWSIRL